MVQLLRFLKVKMVSTVKGEDGKTPKIEQTPLPIAQANKLGLQSLLKMVMVK